MAYDTEDKSAAQLQAEIEEQRHRVESTIDQIQQKLSPGQLVDELLAYAKGGGGDFVSSLQRKVTANPLPVALMGVSLAWLMAKPAPSAQSSSDQSWDDSINARRGYGVDADPDDFDEYPIAIISGDRMTRLGENTNDSGYAEFADVSGNTYRAASDTQGRRAGHFTDKAGQRFGGFKTEAGEKIHHFQDQAGNRLDDASGWASHTWQQAREKIHDARDAVREGAGSMGRKSAATGETIHHQADRLNHAIMAQFRDQPLVAGALAFAAGAALGAALPHTPQEDAVLGDASDSLKAKAGHEAEQLYGEARDKAAELYGSAASTTKDAYQGIKDGLSEGQSKARSSV